MKLINNEVKRFYKKGINSEDEATYWIGLCCKYHRAFISKKAG